jgi:hypothetical protein
LVEKPATPPQPVGFRPCKSPDRNRNCGFPSATLTQSRYTATILHSDTKNLPKADTCLPAGRYYPKLIYYTPFGPLFRT